MEIRKAQINDLNAIAQFNINLASETEDKILDKDTITKGVEFLLKNNQYGVYYVALEDDKIIGQLMYTYEWSDWRNGLFLWIQSVYVDKEYRRKGVFSSLYKTVKNICDSDDNICGIRLYAEKANNSAQDTYINLGMLKCHYDMFEYEK